MKKRARSIIVATTVLFGVAGCNPTFDSVTCTRESDCTQVASNLTCDRDLQMCVKRDAPKLCAKPCGDGFRCEIEEPSFTERCRMDPEAQASVELRSPITGSAFSSGAVPIECFATGPQFVAVRVLVTAPDGSKTELSNLTPVEGSGSAFTTSAFNATDSAEGDHTFVCEMEFGPSDETSRLRSPQVKLVVDRTPPTVHIIADDAWVSTAAEPVLSASVTNPAPAGVMPSPVASATLQLGQHRIEGIEGPYGAWHFRLDLDALVDAATVGSVAYSVTATDAAGNKSSPATGTLKLDGTPPEITVAHDDTVHDYDGPSFTITAQVSSEPNGAPIVESSVKLVRGSESIDGVKGAGDTYTFTVDPKKLGKQGEDRAFQWTIAARDEAGNEGSATGHSIVDDAGPKIEIAPVLAWQKQGDVVPVSVRVTDSSPLASTDPVRVVGGAPCIKTEDGEFICLVDTASAPTNSDLPGFGFTITATDALGHLSSKGGSMKVDGRAPLVAITTDVSIWLGRIAEVELTAAVSDTGSGPGSSAKVEVNGRTYYGVIEAGIARVMVKPIEFVPVGVTNPALPLSFVALDAAGNEGSASTTLKVDGQPPVITLPDLSGTTYKRTERAIELTVRVAEPAPGPGFVSESVKLSFTNVAGEVVSLAPVSTSGDEFTFRIDADAPRLTGVDPGLVPLTFSATDLVRNTREAVAEMRITRKLWEASIGSGAPIVGAVAATDNKLLVSIGNHLAPKNVIALHRADGSEAWSAKISANIKTPVSVLGSTAYVGSDEAVASGGRGKVHAFALDATGATSELWSCALKNASSADATPGTALAVANVPWADGTSDTVFVSTKEKRIAALRWIGGVCEVKRTISTETVESSAVSFSGRALFGGTKAGRLWRTGIEESADILGLSALTPSVQGNPYVVAGAAITSAGDAVFSHADFVAKVLGDEPLTSELPDLVRLAGIAGYNAATQAAPVLASDTLAYFATDNGRVFGTNLTVGSPSVTLRYEDPDNTAVKSSLTLGRPPPGSALSHVVYAALDDGRVLALDPRTNQGDLLWSVPLGPSSIEASAALGCDGILFVGTTDGTIVAIQTDSPGLLPSSWPRFQHDNRNTGSLTTPIADAFGACVD